MNQSNQAQFAANKSTQQHFSSQYSSADLLDLLRSKWLHIYDVVCGGYGPDQLAPVVPYARFRTEGEAETFKANVSLDFPDCRVTRMGRLSPGNEEELIEFLDSIFYKDFIAIANSDGFDQKVKCGNALLMRRGISPKEGDIIAIGRGDDLCRRIARYQPGMDCFAVCVRVATDLEQMHQFEEVA